ncbi:hypothetical protein BDZ89DRAFT_1085225 [Hymenopellis radicata]|nr:hypothetical protein BDZ89DRAFT_1085225 [Hymenopellis radicata]
MSKPRVLSSHPPAVREAAKAVADLYGSSMLSRREMHQLTRRFKHGHDIVYSPRMARYTNGTCCSRLGLMHRGRRIVCADELYKVFLSFRLDTSLETIRTKINAAFCDIPPDAIVAWHAKISEHYFKPETNAGVGGGIVVAATLSDASEAGPAALVSEGAAGPSSQTEGADSHVAVISDSSPSPSDDNGDAVSEALPTRGAGGIVVGPATNDASEAGAAAPVSEGAAGLSSQAEGAKMQSVEAAEADSSCGPSSNNDRTVSQDLSAAHLPLVSNDTILSANTIPFPSSPLPSDAMTSTFLSAPEAPSLLSQLNNGPSNTAGSSESVLGKRSLPTDDDTDVASVPTQASPKRQKRHWWTRFLF